MSIAVILYLIDLLDKFFNIAIAIAIGCVIIWFGSLSVKYVGLDGDPDYRPSIWKSATRWGNTAFAALFVVLVFIIAVPQRTTMYLMVASGVAEQIVKLEEVQGIGKEAADLARVSIEALRNQISEGLKPSE
jgi:hypothetical protein